MNIKLAFVDLETTGTTAQSDRITEIGMVLVDESGVREWSSLVDPGRPIPPMITSLTGISDAMVAGAPRFADLAGDIAARLDGYLFVAHNARFDEGFLQHEFLRLGRRFHPQVLCTVRLSRKLYPQYRRHNLDSIIERHGLSVHARHRALDDARLLWHFWQSVHREFPPEQVAAAVDALSARVQWPAWLDPGLPDLMPDAHGVYTFYNAGGQPLYVGRAERLRAQVLGHFQPGRQRTAKAARLAEQVRRIEWRETGGVLGALLHENLLLRQLAPSHNRRSRRPAAAATPWPYDGPVGLREGRLMHVVHEWEFLGSAASDEELHDLLDRARAEFDADVYRILRDRIRLVPLVRLPGGIQGQGASTVIPR